MIEAIYEVPYLAHAPMEPLNATVHVQADRRRRLGRHPGADLALTFAAKASGVKPENIYIHNCFSAAASAGGSVHDEVVQAVAVSKAVGKPVKLIWTREEEIRHGRYRTQAAIRFKAGFAADGTPVALDMRNSAGSSNPANVKNGVDPQTLQGLINTGYQLPNFRIVSILKNTHVPLGSWRAPGHSQNVFFMESFIDEMAHATGKDPVELRRKLLARSARFPAGARCPGREGRLGQADAARQRARHRRPRELRHRSSADRRGVGGKRRGEGRARRRRVSTAASSSIRAASRCRSKAA